MSLLYRGLLFAALLVPILASPGFVGVFFRGPKGGGGGGGGGGGRSPGRTPTDPISPSDPDNNPGVFFEPNSGPKNQPKYVPDPLDPNKVVHDIPQQEEIRHNMDTLESALEAIQFGLDVAQEVFDAQMPSFVSAALTTQSCTWPTITPTRPCDPNRLEDTCNQDIESGPGSDTMCHSTKVTFTPTATLPTTSFAACTTYARILSQCANKTTSFYALDPTDQAKCACYATATPDNDSCTKDETVTVIPTLAATRLDSAAINCRDYFKNQGYEQLGNLLSGSNNNRSVLGAAFCAKLNVDLTANANTTNGTLGLPATRAGVLFHVCKGRTSYGGGGGGGGGGRVVSAGTSLGSTEHNRAVLITSSALLAIISYLLV